MTRAAWLTTLALLIGCGDDASPDAGEPDAASSDAGEPDAGGPVDAAAIDDAAVDDAAIDDAGPSVAVRIDDLAARPSPRSVLSYFVEWRTDRPTRTELRVRCGAADAPLHEASMDGDGERTTHEVFVMGLLAEQPCAFTAVARRGAASDEATVEVRVAALPEEIPDGIVTGAADRSLARPGWTLLGLADRASDRPLVVVALDLEGRVRWYRISEGDRRGGAQEVSAQPEGLLVGSAVRFEMRVWGWDGEELWIHPGAGAHHDVRRHPGRGHLTYLTHGEGSCYGSAVPGGVTRWDLAAAEVAWTWWICDHYVPRKRGPDWAHLNSLAPVPGRDALLLSLRHQDHVILVDEPTGAVVWRLGEEGDFAMPESARFEQQHGADWLGDGRVLLFDNGAAGRRESSRALEIEIDEVAMTARVAWQHAPPEGWWAPFWGDADRLDSGTTLITFGGPSAGERAHVIEVTDDGRRALHLTLPDGWGTYRAKRIDPPPTMISVDELPRGLVR